MVRSLSLSLYTQQDIWLWSCIPTRRKFVPRITMSKFRATFQAYGHRIGAPLVVLRHSVQCKKHVLWCQTFVAGPKKVLKKGPTSNRPTARARGPSLAPCPILPPSSIRQCLPWRLPTGILERFSQPNSMAW